MNEKNTFQSIEQRIIQSLQLAEARGYNLTVEQLASKLIGGSVSPNELRKILSALSTVTIKNNIVATQGNLHLEKCLQRQQTNTMLQPYYHRIATEFVNEYTRLCPWVQCMMIAGSMASEGLGKGDDIDFDLIVPDGLKYTSNLLALLLSFKYSFRYGKDFWRRYVICISVIWETHQVHPFQRKDGQLAFELLNVKVIYNPDFFQQMVDENDWLKQYYPQLFQHPNQPSSISYRPPQKRILKTFIEWASKNILFLMVKVAIATVFQDHDVKQRMMIKHPYALFDEP